MVGYYIQISLISYTNGYRACRYVYTRMCMCVGKFSVHCSVSIEF